VVAEAELVVAVEQVQEVLVVVELEEDLVQVVELEQLTLVVVVVELEEDLVIVLDQQVDQV
tara:strand:+ start:414 stop:596 length:183 start_codon:yes stop_codon:yes gene_type:complete